jgi:hypothetical protein
MHDLAGRQLAGDAIQKLDCAQKDKILGGSPSMANSPDSAAQSRIAMCELKWPHAERQSLGEPSTWRLAKDWRLSSEKLKTELQGSRNHRSCGIWQAG